MTFDETIKDVTAQLRSRLITQFAVVDCKATGLCVYVKTVEGWKTDPVWTEHGSSL
jgi:hypothetical protein